MRAYRWLVALVFMAGGLHAQTVGSLASSACPLAGCAQGGTGTVTTTSTLVSGRVALSSGAASLTDDAGCTVTGTGSSFFASFGGGVITPLYTSGPGKSGTNVGGTNNTIQAEPGTGNATGSSIIFQTPTATTSGTDAQTQATVLTLQDSGTGGTSAPQALFAAGTSVVPSIAPVAWPDEGLYFNNGAIRFGIGSAVAMVLSGAGGSSGAYLNLLTPRGIILSSATGDVFIRPSTATNTLEIGDLPSATPAAQTLTFQGSRGGTDTNTAGVVATITGSLGTGTAAPGPIAFKVGTAQASGTTQHVAATVMTFDNVGAAGTAAPVAIAAGVIRLKGYTVATLPAGTVGDTAYVTDALAPAFGVALVGGGAVVIPAFYDGANWIAH